MTQPSPTSEIRVRDSPGLRWFLAILFIGVGSAFVYVGLARSAGLPGWQGPLATMIGLVGLSVGIWWGWQSPLSIVTVRPGRQELQLTQIGFFGRRFRSFAFSEIEDVIAEHQSDDEGATMVRPVLLLRDGRRLPLSALWRHDPQGIAGDVTTIRSAIRLPPH